MKDLRTQLLGLSEPVSAIHQVTTSLKIHSGAGVETPTIPGSPLPPGTKVAVLSKQGEWCRVEVLQPVNGHEELHGWVHGNYLKQLT
jgi:hypothetical protein